MSNTGHVYTEEQEQFLRDMCKTPASYGEITNTFNRQFRTTVSRSAILGKCDRMGIREDKISSKTGERAGNRVRSSRIAPLNRYKISRAVASARPPLTRSNVVDNVAIRNDDQATNRIPGPDGPRSNVARVPFEGVDSVFDASVTTAKPFLELRRNECKWPATNDASMACGAEATIGSYCTKHAQIAYRTMPTVSRNRKVLAGGGLLDTRQADEKVGDVEQPILALPSFLGGDAPSIDPGAVDASVQSVEAEDEA